MGSCGTLQIVGWDRERNLRENDRKDEIFYGSKFTELGPHKKANFPLGSQGKVRGDVHTDHDSLRKTRGSYTVRRRNVKYRMKMKRERRL